MPRKYNATQESVIRGGYVPFLLQRDIDQASLKGAVQELNNTNRAAIQQKNVIMEALAKADLNPADAAWRDAYAQQIESELAKEVIGGSYAKALPTAMELAGKVASNPELMARQKANKEYQAHKGVVDNMVAAGKLPQRIADQWLEENPYTFKPVVDKATGRVIGGEEWRPNWRVVEPVDMTQVYAKVGQLAAEEAGGGQNVRFVDENGNPVSNPSSGMYSMEIKTGSTWTRLPAEKLKRIFKAALDQIPGARETFEQDYKNKLWQFGKADDEGKKAFYGSDIIDDQGIKRTLDEYIAYKSDPIFNGMAYNRVHSTVDYGLNSAYFTQKQKAAANASLLNQFGDETTSTSAPIKFDIMDKINGSYAYTQTALDTIKKAFADDFSSQGLNKNLFGGKQLQYYLNNGDYANAANYIQQRLYAIKNPERKEQVRAAIRQLKSQGAIFNAILDGMSDDDRQQIIANAAFASGAPVDGIKNNKYAQDVVKTKNQLFRAYDPNTKKFVPADSFSIAFKNDTEYNNFLNALGISNNDLNKYGLKEARLANHKVISVGKNTPILTKIAETVNSLHNDYLENNSGFLNTFKNLFSTEDDSPFKIYNLRTDGRADYKGEDLFKKGTTQHNPNLLTTLTRLSQTGYGSYGQKAARTIPEILSKYKKDLTVTVPITMSSDFGTQEARNYVLQGILDFDEYKKYATDTENRVKEQVKQALYTSSNFDVYVKDEDTGQMSLIPLKDNKDLQKQLNEYLAEDDFGVSAMPAPSRHGVGWYITFKGKNDKDGNTVKKPLTIFVDGLLDSQAARIVANNPKQQALFDYQTNRTLGAKVYDLEGNRITYDSPNASNKFIGKQLMDELYNNVRAATKANIRINDRELEANIIDNLVTAGLLTPNNIIAPDGSYTKQAASLIQKYKAECINIITNTSTE